MGITGSHGDVLITDFVEGNVGGTDLVTKVKEASFHSPYVSSWFTTADVRTAIPTITIDYGDFDRSNKMEIGGNACHLCGAKMRNKNTYERRTKHGVWKIRVYITYDCKTEVMITEKGTKEVTMGSKCVKAPHE